MNCYPITITGKHGDIARWIAKPDAYVVSARTEILGLEADQVTIVNMVGQKAKIRIESAFVGERAVFAAGEVSERAGAVFGQ